METMNGSEISDFPQLNEAELKDITVAVYQISQTNLTL